MRIIFMGSPEFAIPTLEKLHASQHAIVTVVSGPDKRRGRGNRMTPTPVKAKAFELNLPVIEVDNLRDPDFINRLKQLNPDLFVVVAFRILPEMVLAIPSKGSINLHASLLPRYRGAAPIHHAIMNGERKTGCTVFSLDKHIDTGRIILRKETEIGPNETTGDLYERLKIMGSELVVEAVNRIESGNYELVKQDDSLASPAPKIFQDDARLDFQRPAVEIHNKVRAMNPYPGAWTLLDGRIFKIYRTRYPVSKRLKAGELGITDKGIFAGCADGAVEVLDVQLEGKKVMNAVDFFNGYKGDLKFGERVHEKKKKS